MLLWDLRMLAEERYRLVGERYRPAEGQCNSVEVLRRFAREQA